MQMPEKKVLCKGMVDRIGLDHPKITHRSDLQSIRKEIGIHNHRTALEHIEQVLEPELQYHQCNIDAVGHRVVHGGKHFSKTIAIDKTVKEHIRELASLAPLHNPPNLLGVELAEEFYPNAKQFAVFDTAFHHSIPPKAHTYAIPKKLSETYHIRLYGFHGSSHKYVSQKAIDYLQKKQSKIISLHLGNGCSISAIKNGKSIDHSLGFGPMNGLIMGTRSGDIDQSVLLYLMEKLQLSTKQANELLQKQSGMLGLTGYSDFRDIEKEAKNGNLDCLLALEMNAYRIQKYIGSYIAALQGIDAIVFTAGIGENSAYMRELICQNLDCFGIHLDPLRNETKAAGIQEIQSAEAKTNILVVPTNEELEIAMQVYAEFTAGC